MQFMSSDRKSLFIRCAILVAGGVALFILLSPILYRPRTQTTGSYTFQHPDVSIEFLPDGAQRVRVDGNEETIPEEQLESSPLRQEAWRRLHARSGMGERYFELRWGRIIRWWLPPVVLLYFLLFRWWPPKTDYVTGPRA